MLFRICVACDHANPPDSRFCGKCGAPLQVRFCRLCRTANDAGSHFCQSCGTELPELEAADASNEPARPPAAEPFVIATPGRPVPAAGSASTPVAPTTIESAFAGGEASAARTAEAPAVAPALPLEGTAAPFNPPIVLQQALPRTRRPAIMAILAAIGAVLVAVFAFNALRTDKSNEPVRDAANRNALPAAEAQAPPAKPSAPTPPAADSAAAVGSPIVAPDPAPRRDTVAAPGPVPAPSPQADAPREPRAAPARTAERPPPPPPPTMAPRECTAALAALGLCTPEPKPEGK